MRFALLFFLAAAPLARGGDFRVGGYAIDVTPVVFPISVNGGFADRKATKANDPLHARCVVFDDGKTTVALVVVDSCVLPRGLTDAAKLGVQKRTNIPPGNVLISATHTHTAPTATAVFGSEADPAYVEFLTGKIADGVAKAFANLAPAEVGWGVQREPSELFNRRWKLKPGAVNTDPFGGITDRVQMNPGHLNANVSEQAGTVDPDVSVIAARSPGGRPIAVFANYSLHYVGDLPPLSADYFGVFAGQIGTVLKADAGFVGVMSNGTSGDVNNVNFAAAAIKTAPGERCRAVAGVVAAAAGKAVAGAKYSRTGTIAAATAEVELKVRKPTPAEVERATLILAKLDSRAPSRSDEVYAGETLKLAEYPDSVKLILQAIRIGDCTIAAIPCEVFTETGLAIKAGKGTLHAFTVELANGYNGYLPTPAQHALGGYETWRARSSYLEVKASEVITAKVLELMAAVAK